MRQRIDEDTVARGMSEVVIDVLEPVEVEEEQGDRAFVDRQAMHQPRALGHEGAAIGYAGERVDEGIFAVPMDEALALRGSRKIGMHMLIMQRLQQDEREQSGRGRLSARRAAPTSGMRAGIARVRHQHETIGEW